jgi:hypothetical protein
VSRLLVAQRALTVPGWAKDALWRNARAVPSLDLRFADNKSLVDAVTGASLITFTRASSGTYVDSAGVLQTAAIDVPRFDHNPTTGESLGLLVEEQRTNLALYSQAITLVNWGFQQALSTTLNAATSPDGSPNATLMFENTQTANRFIGQAIGVTNAAHTVSIFAKAKERKRIMFRESSVSGTSATFDLQSGTVAGSEGSPITSIQPFRDGWYRCVMTYTPSSASTRTHSVYLMPDSGTSFATSTYTGDGTSGVFLFGFAVEAGATPTSYIPTTTAAATRSADVASITGAAFSGWYNSSASTIYSEAASSSGAAYTGNIYGFGTSFNDSITHYRQVDFQPVARVRTAGVDEYGAIGNGAIWTGTSPNKFALALATTSGRQASNGALSSGSDDSAIVFPTVSSVSIGSAFTSGYFNGHIRRLVFWPHRLPNSTLQTLTQ